MKIQRRKVEITFTQKEKDIINKFFGEIVEDIYSNDYINLSINEICEELAKYFCDMRDSMIIE